MKLFITSIALATMSVAALAQTAPKPGECLQWQTRDGAILVDRHGNPVLSRFDKNGNTGCTPPVTVKK